MKKKAKKARVTALDRLAAKLRTLLEHETTSIIEIGETLIEIQEQLEPGKWQAWLAENFDLSYRTALRYVTAAAYVGRKSEGDTVSLNFGNLSARVLYALAEGRFNEREEAAILAATREGRVDTGRARAICDALASPDVDDADDADDTDDQEVDVETAAAEAEAIIDGDPPKPPPASTLPPTNFALRDFDAAIGTLNRLKTKTAGDFARTEHSAEVLESVEVFIHSVARVSRRGAAAESDCTDVMPAGDAKALGALGTEPAVLLLEQIKQRKP
jgi:hypothetical protein